MKGIIRLVWMHLLRFSLFSLTVDSADHERLSTSRAELLSMLSEEELKDAKLLVFANKQDLPDKASVSEVSEKLGLDQLKDRSWTIQGCCATKGEGLEDGLDW
jgi:ADP-ribosylation factor-like protein 1